MRTLATILLTLWAGTVSAQEMLDRKLVSGAAFVLSVLASVPEGRIEATSPDRATIHTPGMPTQVARTGPCIFELRSAGASARIDFRLLSGQIIGGCGGQAGCSYRALGLGTPSCVSRYASDRATCERDSMALPFARPEQIRRIRESIAYIHANGCPFTTAPKAPRS